MNRSVKVFAPATVANVVCGYDVLGFAVNAPGDEVIMRFRDEPGVIITKISGDDGRLPYDPAKNTVSVSVQHFLNHIGRSDVGVEIELNKKMPIGSGLGSSSASTVAGLFAINTLMDSPLTKMELVPFAMKGEELACGYGHADNVAPALLGGFVLIRSYEPLDIIQLPFPEELYCSIVFPQVDVPTRDARQIIRSKILLKDAVVQWGNVAGLVSGLYTKNIDLIARSMKDVIVEPVRSISGSGPSVFTFTRNDDDARRINEKLQAHFRWLDTESIAYRSPINALGPIILD
jgi:homoserine kinase